MEQGQGFKSQLDSPTKTIIGVTPYLELGGVHLPIVLKTGRS